MTVDEYQVNISQGDEGDEIEAQAWELQRDIGYFSGRSTLFGGWGFKEWNWRGRRGGGSK